MPMIPYLVSQFAQSTMTNLVKECFGYDFPDILTKRQVTYIYNYLQRLGATTVLLEFDYIDKDFLEDFSRYYVKRYGNDGHQCARMHFFSGTVDHRCITSVLEGGEDAEKIAKLLNDSYLGFMVIKPLPKTFIGKTCLKVMSDKATLPKRKNRMSREYNVDLFGIPLQIESIAFQEQDKVIAACATTAIWSSLHALKWRTVRSIHSCSEITMNALNASDGSSNSFPNTGLSSEEILRSIDAEGLRHHLESLRGVDQKRFFQTVTGHIDSQLPLIFMGDVYSTKSVASDAHRKKKLEHEGSHAICVLGYMDDGENVLYIHDDRLGPYVRALVVTTSSYVNADEIRESWALGLQTMDEDGKWSEPEELIVPDVLIIPSDKKTRLPFYYANETCEAIQVYASVYEHADTECQSQSSQQSNLSYQIRLREISEVRQEIRQHVAARIVKDPTDGKDHKVIEEVISLWQKEKVRFLTQGFARFQWVAQFFHCGEPAFKVLFDATDIPQGDAVSGVYVDNIVFAGRYLQAFENVDLTKIKASTGQFFSSFIRRLKAEDQSLSKQLDDTYGELRAPLYLKAQEIQGDEIFRNPTAASHYDAPRQRVSELHHEFSKPTTEYLIWAISSDGALIIGKELTVEVDGKPEKCGHPSITGFKPARIAGEMWKVGGGWQINAKSGRYSGDYVNLDKLLRNALYKFRSFFHDDEFQLQPLPAQDGGVLGELGPCAALLKEQAVKKEEFQANK